MRLRSIRFWLVLAFVAGLPFQSPAPLIYRPGEGWIYVSPSEEEGGDFARGNAREQLTVAEEAYANENWRTAQKAARRVVTRWPLSDYAPEAQFLVARCYEERGQYERAFDAYQKAIEEYPRSPRYEAMLERQYVIANQFLAGRWFRLWGWIPTYPSMEKTVDLYSQLIDNGPYSEVAPEAQMKIGAAREKQEDYVMAVRAYERAADRYYDDRSVAADAVFKAAEAYNKQAKTAEYDQSVAGMAIDTYTDFTTLFPNDPRASQAYAEIARLREEQARGAYEIARYYEKNRHWRGAVIYYNEVLLKDSESPYAEEARQRIERLNARIEANRESAESNQ